MRKSNVKIVHNKLLNGWFIVRGPHQTPIGGRFETRAAAQNHLDNMQNRYVSHVFNIGGNEYYRNKAGRCEDAPCCGCCTI